MTALTIALALAAPVLAWLLWRQWREFRKLKRWASQPRLSDPPEASGAWGEVFTMLHRHRRATLRRRRQLAQVIVRTRRGAQALPYGVVMLDGEYRVNWCNDAAREHLGLDAEQDRGQPILNFVREPAFVEYVRRAELFQPVRLQSGGPHPRTLSLQIVSFGQDLAGELYAVSLNGPVYRIDPA